MAQKPGVAAAVKKQQRAGDEAAPPIEPPRVLARVQVVLPADPTNVNAAARWLPAEVELRDDGTWAPRWRGEAQPHFAATAVRDQREHRALFAPGSLEYNEGRG